MGDVEDDARIFHLAEECDDLFTKYLNNIETLDVRTVEDNLLKSIIQLGKDYQARFNAWLSYMGVFAEEKLSLDRRLANNADIAKMFAVLLVVLKQNLQDQHQKRLDRPQALTKELENDLMNDEEASGRTSTEPKKALEDSTVAISRSDVVDHRSGGEIYAQMPGAPQKSLKSVSEEKPSTLRASEFRRMLEAHNAGAGGSDTSPTSSAPAGEISYPRPPKIKPREPCVTCQWCFETLPAHRVRTAYRKPSGWWRHHVDKDLKPYICLAADKCSEDGPFFSDIASWRAHMNEMHTSNWTTEVHPEPLWTCDVDHVVPMSFPSRESLASHLQNSHGALFTSLQIASIVRRNFRYKPRETGVCPFACTYDAKRDPSIADEGALSGRSPKNSEMVPKSEINRKRPGVRTQGKTKRRRKVGFVEAEQQPQETQTTSEHSSEDLSDDQQDISGKARNHVLQNMLSRHISMHLKSLAFLTLRFKELQDQDRVSDGDSSPQQRSIDDTGNSERQMDLDEVSLTFEENPIREPNDDELFEGLYDVNSFDVADSQDSSSLAGQQEILEQYYLHGKDHSDYFQEGVSEFLKDHTSEQDTIGQRSTYTRTWGPKIGELKEFEIFIDSGPLESREAGKSTGATCGSGLKLDSSQFVSLSDSLQDRPVISNETSQGGDCIGIGEWVTQEGGTESEVKMRSRLMDISWGGNM
ncbi:hypothetical protein FZEAL_8366 [Fusarium zealandicum]|uniref:Uncharacterized protein n=1 Tax=Fusarium zealandicum TaxID=1053134 RepID=A0A8H4UDX7_9HYPO|nr:hypothetical protein FZEAL_8366 [Fusarium zealandicum]